MIYDEQTLIQKLREMMKNHENEVVEFKEAKNDKSFNEIGQYFSALSNEANLRGKTEGWLIFGVTNVPEIVGTNYRSEGRSLKEAAKLAAADTGYSKKRALRARAQVEGLKMASTRRT
mgnify:CR=1 FL=1